MDDFDVWTEQVNAAIAAKCGLSAADLPDYCYRDEYEDGCDPEETAEAALDAAGW